MSETMHAAGQGSHRSPDASEPGSLLSTNPGGWWRVFGPGAVIASLTIGAGELIFSSRAGALFGYRLLWFFGLILLFKWALVFASARHMVLTGAHPFQRWMQLAGPAGWFPLVFVLLALPCFPIWVCFHAGTVGTLMSSLAGTEGTLGGTAHLLWGAGILSGVLWLIFTGGYSRLERLQTAIIVLMVVAVLISLYWLKPDWPALLQGLVLPQWPTYPPWVSSYPDIAARPVWVETITYVGVIGGSGYDYLAYVSYLRDKGWGQAGKQVATTQEIEAVAADQAHPNRQWVRACLIDSALSFLAVVVFTAVFVACGAAVLSAKQQVPNGTNLLALQAGFVTPIFPWLEWVYFAGAFLAMFGTLYGTIEVAPTILRELLLLHEPVQRLGKDESPTSNVDVAQSSLWDRLRRSVSGRAVPPHPSPLPAVEDVSHPAPGQTVPVGLVGRRQTILPLPEGEGRGEVERREVCRAPLSAISRRWAVLWVGLGGLLLLLASILYALWSQEQQPPGLVALLTPANLFTGVLACGLICLLNCWMDWRFLPPSLRMSWALALLNLAAGVIFVTLGLKGYWDHGGWTSFAIFAGTLAAGWIAAASWNRLAKS